MKRSSIVVGLCAALAVVWVMPAASGNAESPGSGLRLPGYDQTARPQDDLFQFANGAWVRDTEIPADKSRYGTFDILAEASEKNLRAIISDSAARNGATGSEDQQLADLYASFIDTKQRDKLGVTPLADELARIDKIAGPEDLVRYFGEATVVGLSSPIGLSIDQDAKNAKAYVPYVSQGGLTLPDRDYYLNSDAKSVKSRDQLSAYVTRVLGLGGVADPTGSATSVLNLEKRLAEAQWSNERNRDAVATYNKFTPAKATAASPGLDWNVYLAAAGVRTANFVVAQPSFFTALGKTVTTTSVDDWKRYLRFKLVDDYAPLLGKDLVTASFEFHGRDLGGQKEMRPDWKRGVATVEGSLGEALGKRYVERHFTPEAKRRMDQLVTKLISAYRTSIDGLDWMSAKTKTEAKKKLDKLSVKIGYPTKWRDYSKLEILADDLVGNLERSARLEHQRAVNKIGKPVDRAEWHMTPQTVNAYYNPSMNEIVFPAAILQPPFFDQAADDAVNYGAIGAVIGHEISHAFDDQGSQYDGDGNLRNWWTAEDKKRFDERTAALTAQYSSYEALPGQRVNGKLTLGENIADLSGLTVALRAYQLSLGGKPAPEIDGFSGEKRFFLGWAQVWREKARDEAVRSRLLTDPHSPARFRANGVVTNVSEYYDVFGLKPGDKLFRPANQRVKIW